MNWLKCFSTKKYIPKETSYGYLQLIADKETITLHEFKEILHTYSVSFAMQDIFGLCNTLSPNFYTQPDKDVYHMIQYVEFDKEHNILRRSSEFSLLLQNENYLRELYDCLEYGLEKAYLRKMNECKALAVAATGTGKTYMSVFDVMQVNPKRVLFVVHRGDILIKAKESFDKIISKTTKDYSSGIYDRTPQTKNCKYVFVTEAMLALHLDDFLQDDFDYIIIDEAHHAADNSYSKIIN